MTAIINLSSSGLLKISGPNAKKLLQGQLTCDLEEITPTQNGMGALCNPQGRVISFFAIFLYKNSYYLLMPENMIAITLSTLQKFAVFYKVTLDDVTRSLFIMGCIDSDSCNQLDALDATFIKIPVKNNRLVIVGDINGLQQLWNELQEQLPISSPEYWKYLDICAGIPSIYPETSGKFLPHELNLPALNAVSFTKGCYTGQEIIARMHYRGKLKTHMHQAIIFNETPILPGSDIYCKEEEKILAIGTIIDSCIEQDTHHLGYNSYRTLILIDDDNAKNNHLFLNRENPVYFMMV